MPHFEDATMLLITAGWQYYYFLYCLFLVYIGGLMCSHLAAFRIASNIRIDAMHHIVKLPLGFARKHSGSGKLRKINE